MNAVSGRLGDKGELNLTRRRLIETMTRYQLISANEIHVAFSGGKDSIALAKILKACGIQPKLVAVDMDYNPAWANRIKVIAEHLECDVTVLRAHAMIESQSIQPNSASLRLNLQVLESLPTVSRPSSYTPCTPCYNSKVLSLDGHLQSIGVDRVAFAHHGTDSAASLVKAALMYIDRWEMGNREYSPRNLRLLTSRLKNELLGQIGLTGAPLISRITKLVDERLASTDEPPTQLLESNSPVRIVRPLFGLWESDIVEMSREWNVTPESSGCGHSMSAETYTPREIVNFECLREVEQSGRVRARQQMRAWIEASVDTAGKLLSDTRRRRRELLGDQYKPGAMGVGKL